MENSKVKEAKDVIKKAKAMMEKAEKLQKEGEKLLFKALAEEIAEKFANIVVANAIDEGYNSPLLDELFLNKEMKKLNKEKFLIFKNEITNALKDSCNLRELQEFTNVNYFAQYLEIVKILMNYFEAKYKNETIQNIGSSLIINNAEYYSNLFKNM